MSKATTIRKKALDLVRQQDWPNAIKEYRRLVEIDQNNPNVHNELADLYLRTGQKSEAFDSFMQAIDEYTRVGLYNNAVALCKKVLRVLPARIEVLNKLGLIRMKQGLAKEAESYYLSFLDKAAGGALDAADFKKLASAIADEMATSPAVIQRLAQCLLGYRLNDEAGDVLIKLYLLQQKNGDASGCEDTRALVTKLGLATKLDAVSSASEKTDRTVVTEDTLWTKKHSEGERIDVESTPRFTPPSQSQAAPASPQPAGAAPGGPSERDQWLLRLARGVGGGKGAKSKAPAPAEAGAAPNATVTEERKPADVDDASHERIESDDDRAHVSSGRPEKAPDPERRGATNPKDPTQISALIDDAGGEDGEEDYRSHYDLGMAYMEMELLAEAIREYQIASKSPHFQVKCLEMIGLCFLKQDQPHLAIRQLTKGLSLIGDDGDESMGIKYNLGLAYEMAGDLDNARTHFEDVYVVDVTFREVAEKVRKLSGG